MKRKKMLKLLKKEGIDPNTLTCASCESKKSCEYAFDPYNTDGDCLAAK